MTAAFKEGALGVRAFWNLKPDETQDYFDRYDQERMPDGAPIPISFTLLSSKAAIDLFCLKGATATVGVFIDPRDPDINFVLGGKDADQMVSDQYRSDWKTINEMRSKEGFCDKENEDYTFLPFADLKRMQAKTREMGMRQLGELPDESSKYVLYRTYEDQLLDEEFRRLECQLLRIKLKECGLTPIEAHCLHPLEEKSMHQ